MTVGARSTTRFLLTVNWANLRILWREFVTNFVIRHDERMKRRERGSASLEFVVVALGVLVPVLAVTVTVSEIQRAQFATVQIARSGVRAVALAPTVATGQTVAKRIAALVQSDLGVSGSPRFTLACEPRPCGTTGSLYRLTVTLRVKLPLIPTLPGLDVAPRIPVSATATHRAPLPVMP